MAGEMGLLRGRRWLSHTPARPPVALFHTPRARPAGGRPCLIVSAYVVASPLQASRGGQAPVSMMGMSGQLRSTNGREDGEAETSRPQTLFIPAKPAAKSGPQASAVRARRA